MRKRLVFILIICSTLFFSGCWGRRELNEISIITGMALDAGRDGYHLTIIGTDPTKKGGQETGGDARAEYNLYSASGSSTFDAARNLTLIIPRRNLWSHCELIVIGEEHARKEGVREVLEFFTRDHARRETARLVVSNGKAHDFMETLPSMSRDPATEVLSVLTISKAAGKGIQMPIYRFLAETGGVTGTSLADYFTVKDYGGPSQVSGRGKELVLVGAGVFYKYRLLGFLTPSEARAANWLREEVKAGVITFPSQHDGLVDSTMEISKVRTKINPLLNEEGGKVQVSLEVTGGIVEYLGKEKIMEEKVLKKLEEACSKVIEQEIRDIWRKAKNEFHTDFFGLGDRFANRYGFLVNTDPEQWREIFQILELELDVKTVINESGIRRESFGR